METILAFASPDSEDSSALTQEPASEELLSIVRHNIAADGRVYRYHSADR